MTIPAFEAPSLGERLVFGGGSVHDMGPLLEGLGRRRPLVVCTWRRHRGASFAHLAAGLGTTPRVFEGVEPHTPAEVVEAAWSSLVEAEADAVVSFGGGSAVDLGKALVFVSLRGLDALDRDLAAVEAIPVDDRLAHVAVSTTYSGAAASRWFWVSEGGTKRRGGGSATMPDRVVADPSLTEALPWKPTATTAFAALGLCFDVLTETGIAKGEDVDEAERVARTIVQVLPILSRELGRPSERSDLLSASLAAGSLADGGNVGFHQALVQALGGRTGVAHGVAAAALLPAVLRRGRAGGFERFVRAIGESDAAAAADRLERMLREFGLPRLLRESAVFEDDLPAVASSIAGREDEALDVLRAAR